MEPRFSPPARKALELHQVSARGAWPTFAWRRQAEDLTWRTDPVSAALSTVERFVAEPAIAIVGVSRSGGKFGNAAARELRAKGYRVYPIHPGAEEIDGMHCYADFEALPEHVNAVLVVVPPHEALSVVRDAAKAGVHQVWLQQGAESADVLNACRALNLSVISGECILMFAEPAAFYHRIHRWVWRLLGKLPR